MSRSSGRSTAKPRRWGFSPNRQRLSRVSRFHTLFQRPQSRPSHREASRKQAAAAAVTEPVPQLKAPLSIQHAKGDGSTGVNSSLELAARLYMAGREYRLFIYDSDDHLFSGDDFEQAVERDVQWFTSHR